MRGSFTVAVCDILGFSRLVLSAEPLAAVVDNAIGWFRKALSHSLLKSGLPSDVPMSRLSRRRKVTPMSV